MSKSTAKILKIVRIVLIFAFALTALRALGTGNLTAPIFPLLMVFLLTGQAPRVLKSLGKKFRKRVAAR